MEYVMRSSVFLHLCTTNTVAVPVYEILARLLADFTSLTYDNLFCY